MAGTHFRGPLLGDLRSVGGLFRDFPIELVASRELVVYYNDFTKFQDWGTTPAAGSATLNNWTITQIGTVTVGTVALGTDAAPLTTALARHSNGVLLVTPDATINEGYHVQQTNGGPGELWLPDANRTIMFEARIAHGDWDDNDFFIGLAETNASLVGSTGVLTSDNFIGFHHLVADAGILDCVAAGTADANEESFGAANSAVWTDEDYHRVGFRILGTSTVEFYVDGVKVQEGEMTTAFDDAMCVSFGTVSNGTADVMAIDYITVAQTRI